MTDGVVRYHLPWQQYVWWHLPLTPSLVLLVPQGGSAAVTALATFAWGAVGLAAMWRRFGAEVRPDALVLYGVRRRVFPWSRIERGERAKVGWSTCVKVHADGRAWTLRAPQHTRFIAPDREFDAKLETVQRAWVARRVDRWTPQDA